MKRILSQEAKKEDTKSLSSKKLKLKNKYDQIRPTVEYSDNFYNQSYLRINTSEEINYTDYQNQFLDAYSYYQSNGQDYANNTDDFTTNQIGFQTNFQDQCYPSQDNYQETFYHYQNFSNTF